MDVVARLDAVEGENDMLRARIAQLEELLGFSLKAPIVLRLTGSEGSVFGALMARDLVTKEHVMAALYRNYAKDEAEIKIVDVFICKIRKKLKPFKIEIETVWGVGYRMNTAMKALARTLYDESKAAA
jgi:two-component system, cell cycle response regulator CtrA